MVMDIEENLAVSCSGGGSSHCASDRIFIWSALNHVTLCRYIWFAATVIMCIIPVIVLFCAGG